MMVQFFWLSGSHVARWKFSQKQKVREPQIKPKTLNKSSVKCFPLILIQIINGFYLNAQMPFFCLLSGKNPAVWFAGKNVRINSSFMSIFESENVIIPASGATLIVLQTHLWTNTLPVPYCVCPAKKQPMQHKLSHSKSLQEDACN